MADDRFNSITPSREHPPELDSSVAHPARVYDYWLGGKDNYPADRTAAEQVIAVRPSIRFDIRANQVSTRQTRRTYAETARFFDGLELVEPGLVQVHRWRPDPGATRPRPGGLGLRCDRPQAMMRLTKAPLIMPSRA